MPNGSETGAASIVDVLVNGESLAIDAGSSVADLIVRLELARQAVAVEVNLDLVPRARHAETRLQAGDRVEIVTLVGGG
jgi:sulfur carrier protein